MSVDKYPSIFSGQIETVVYLPYSNSQLDNQKPSLLPLRYQVTDLNAKFWAEFGYRKYLIVPFPASRQNTNHFSTKLAWCAFEAHQKGTIRCKYRFKSFLLELGTFGNYLHLNYPLPLFLCLFWVGNAIDTDHKISTAPSDNSRRWKNIQII